MQISNESVTDFQSVARLQQQLQEYSDLVKEQDRMIEEVEGLNVKLMAERDALLQFRRGNSQENGAYDAGEIVPVEPFDAAVQRMLHNSKATGGTANSKPPSHDTVLMSQRLIHDSAIDATVAAELLQDPSSTPIKNHTAAAAAGAPNKAKDRNTAIMSSLIVALRDEKRQRLAVEEQSSKLISEQQLSIHRLEQQVKDLQTANRALGGSGNILTPSKAAAARTAKRDAIGSTTPVGGKQGVSGNSTKGSHNTSSEEESSDSERTSPQTSRGAGNPLPLGTTGKNALSASPAPLRPNTREAQTSLLQHQQPQFHNSNRPEPPATNPRSLNFYDGEEGGDFDPIAQAPHQTPVDSHAKHLAPSVSGGFLENGFGSKRKTEASNSTGGVHRRGSNNLTSEQQELRALSGGRNDGGYDHKGKTTTADDVCCSPAPDYAESPQNTAAEYYLRRSASSTNNQQRSMVDGEGGAASKSTSRRSSTQREFDEALGATGFIQHEYGISSLNTDRVPSAVRIPKLPLTFSSNPLRNLEGGHRGTTPCGDDDDDVPPTEGASYRETLRRKQSGSLFDSQERESDRGSLADRSAPVVSVPMSAQSSARSDEPSQEPSLMQRALSLSQQMQDEVGRARSSSRSRPLFTSTAASAPVKDLPSSSSYESDLERIRKRHNL